MFLPPYAVRRADWCECVCFLFVLFLVFQCYANLKASPAIQSSQASNNSKEQVQMWFTEVFLTLNCFNQGITFSFSTSTCKIARRFFFCSSCLFSWFFGRFLSSALHGFISFFYWPDWIPCVLPHKFSPFPLRFPPMDYDSLFSYHYWFLFILSFDMCCNTNGTTNFRVCAHPLHSLSHPAPNHTASPPYRKLETHHVSDATMHKSQHTHFAGTLAKINFRFSHKYLAVENNDRQPLMTTMF